MRRMGWLVLLTVGVLFAAPLAVRADIAMPRDRWTDIRMVSEQVKIVLSPTKVTVEGTYYLKNERDTVTAVVGYPRGVLEKSLDDFTVTVDDKPVTVLSQPGRAEAGRMEEPARPQTGKPVKSSYQFEGPYPEWKTFNVDFAAGQQRKVVVSYHVTPAELKTVDKGKLLAYVYALTTGATWKGNIDEAQIEVTLDGLSMQDIVTVTPKAGKTTVNRAPLLWVFKDFKPTQNIELTFRTPEAK